MTDTRPSLIIYSPAGVVPTAAPVRKALKRLTALGFAPTLDASALSKHQRFAGDDAERLAAIHRVAEASPAVALATRGGYGLTRLLDQIEWPLIARSVEQGTAWVGYSDVTALQLAALAHKAAGPETVEEGVTAGFWAGPMASDDFGRADSPEGTLLQLHQGGILDQQKAILLGTFNGFKKSPLDRGYTLKTVIAYLRTLTSAPILTGLPFGHVPTKLCLPLGRKVNLVVQGRDVLVMW